MLFTRLNRTQLICKICLRSLLAITACATFFTAIAQCPPNGITTNPDNTDWSAPIYNALYKKNTGTNLFDWRQQQFSVFMPTFPFSQVTSPYYFDGTALALAGIAQGEGNPTKYDFYPEDGWELIKKGFGKKSDGTIITNEVAIGPYYILYNKYSATLRVIGWLSSAVGYFPTMNVRLGFRSGTVSGLFSYYNSTAIPLDQPSPTVYATTPAEITGVQNAPFFADFKLAYDPCTCQFQSNITVEFVKVQNMIIDLYGRILATGVPIDDPLVNADLSLKRNDFLTSVYNVENNSDFRVTAGLLTYRNMGSLLSDYNSSANSTFISAWLSEGFDLLAKGTGAIGGVLTKLEKESTAKTLEATSVVSDFFSALLGSKETVMPTVIQGEMALTGQITNSVDQRISVPLATPGSLNSQNAPECCVGSGPYYPQYNEVLGLFAILETPKAKLRFGFVPNSPTRLMNEVVLTSPLKYVFNPAANVNPTTSRVYTSYKIDVITSIPFNQTNSFVAPDNFENIFLRYQKDGDSNFAQKATLTTPMVPIESQINLSPQFNTHNTSNLIITLMVMLDLEFYGLNKNGQPNRAMMILSYPTSGGFLGGSFSSISPVAEFLTLPTTNYDGTTYPANNAWQTSFAVSAWKDITISGDQTACKPSRAGSCTSYNTATISAGGNVSVQAGVSLRPGITIRAGISPMTLDQTLRPQTSDQVNTFCTNGSYKSNSLAARVASSENHEENPKELYNKETIAFPNPTTGKVSFRYYVEEPSQVRLNLISTTGSVVATPVDAYQEAGPYEFAYDASNLPAGIYIYTLETSKGKETKRLVVVK